MILSFKKWLHQGESRTIKVKKNIFQSFFIRGFSIIIQLLLVPLVLGYVTPNIYGIWLTLSTFLLWIGFFDVGFSLGLKNKLTEALAFNDYEKGKRLVSTTYIIIASIFIPLAIILIIIIPYINWYSFFNVNKSYNESIINSLYAIVICFSFQIILQTISSVISAYQKVALSSAISMIGNLCALIAIFIQTKFFAPSLERLAVTLASMQVLSLVFFTLYLYQGDLKKIAPSIHYFDKKCLHDLFGLGYKFLLINLQVIILNQSTNFLISWVDGPKAVAQFDTSMKYLSIVYMLQSIVIAPLWPAFTDAYILKDYMWMNKIYKKMIIFITALIVLELLILVPCSGIVFKLWIGDKLSIPFDMTVLVSIYLCTILWNGMHSQILNGIGHIKLQSYLTLVGLLVFLPLSVILGKWIGANGIIISMICITLVYCFVFTIQTRKILKQKANSIWIE